MAKAISLVSQHIITRSVAKTGLELTGVPIVKVMAYDSIRLPVVKVKVFINPAPASTANIISLRRKFNG